MDEATWTNARQLVLNAVANELMAVDASVWEKVARQQG